MRSQTRWTTWPAPNRRCVRCHHWDWWTGSASVAPGETDQGHNNTGRWVPSGHTTAAHFPSFLSVTPGQHMTTFSISIVMCFLIGLTDARTVDFTNSCRRILFSFNCPPIFPRVAANRFANWRAGRSVQTGVTISKNRLGYRLAKTNIATATSHRVCLLIV